MGGIAWLIAIRFRRRTVAFLMAYAVVWLASLWIAPVFGRVPLPCGSQEALRVQSWVYCVLNRNYVVPELRDTAFDLAAHLSHEFPGTVTLALDGNFPFVDGFPLLPHLSHDDGRKLDLAFFYSEGEAYMPGRVRSPVGYFAFEQGVSQCPETLPTLRWNLAWLQPFMAPLVPEPKRMKAALDWLANDHRVRRVFIEPHLKERFEIHSDKIAFQGCRAARHDDHIHFEIHQ
ncbi:hypothetical protein [Devosia nitrariae]|uniref:Uncharacterized protein n=1 Tax=Devosia nitrariae TaxID=2071872 RepID=A0ABQ5W8I5_9HYPH|nr:hypothetical protein [Devosia nitrariae]GLQ56409.1 hypothetical protein GCM10010862_36680 [Devosia nitrariae]